MVSPMIIRPGPEHTGAAGIHPSPQVDLGPAPRRHRPEHPAELLGLAEAKCHHHLVADGVRHDPGEGRQRLGHADPATQLGGQDLGLAPDRPGCHLGGGPHHRLQPLAAPLEHVGEQLDELDQADGALHVQPLRLAPDHHLRDLPAGHRAGERQHRPPGGESQHRGAEGRGGDPERDLIRYQPPLLPCRRPRGRASSERRVHHQQAEAEADAEGDTEQSGVHQAYRS